MTRYLTIFSTAALLLLSLAMAQPAHAGHPGGEGWSFGAGFHVGGVQFQVGYWGGRGTGFGHPGYAPGLRRGHSGYGVRGLERRSLAAHPGVPYFQVSRPIHYPGVACSNACYRGGGGTFHHASCPLVSHHFRRHGTDPYRTIQSYGPRYGSGYSQGHRAPYGYGYGASYSQAYPRYDRYFRGQSRYSRYDRSDH